MFYKIDSGSNLHQEFCKFNQSCINARSEANKLMDKYVGDPDVNYYDSDFIGVICGGISAICFDNQPDMNMWKKVKHGYMPKCNTEFYKEIQKLPLIKYESLNSIINFEPFNVGKRYFGSYSINEVDGQYFIDTKGNKKYCPVDGMIEILYSEYCAKIDAHSKNNVNF